MARIADKHGLTNKYRSTNIGKRVVKRGRPRTRLLGSTRRRKSTNYSVSASESKVAAIVLAVIAGAVLCWFAPIFIPIVLGAVLLGCGDALLKKVWNLPNGKWSAPASVGWMIITSLEMIVSFFMGIFVLIGELTAYALVIDVVIYIALSVLILIGRHKRILRKRSKEQPDTEY